MKVSRVVLASAPGWLIAACGGAVYDAADTAGDAATPDAGDAALDVADAARSRLLCEFPTGMRACDNIADCVWRNHCDGDGGFCTHPRKPSCSECEPFEQCMQIWERVYPSSPCEASYLCVVCDPHGHYPYNCADAAP
jgi:hypothetical protein